MIYYKELNPKGHPIPPECLESAFRLYYVVNVIRRGFGIPIVVSRAFSTVEEQSVINPGVSNSPHVTFEAADLVTSDNSKTLWTFLMDNFEQYVIGLDIYLEEKLYTPKHVHLQIRPVPSGKRVFIP